jgi:hypothetical protein
VGVDTTLRHVAAQLWPVCPVCSGPEREGVAHAARGHNEPDTVVTRLPASHERQHAAVRSAQKETRSHYAVQPQSLTIILTNKPHRQPSCTILFGNNFHTTLWRRLRGYPTQHRYLVRGLINMSVPNQDVRPTRFSRTSTVRTKTGCMVCRRRRVKRDERLPTCAKCEALRLHCRYAQRHPQDATKQEAALQLARARTDYQGQNALSYAIPFKMPG